MKLKPVVTWVIVLGFSTPSCLSMADNHKSWTFAEARNEINSFAFQTKPSSEEDRLSRSMLKSLDAIYVSYISQFGSDADTVKKLSDHLGASYRESIADDLDALQSSPTDSAARLALLQAAETDLHVKAQSASKSLGLTQQFPSTIAVQIIVKLVGSQSDTSPADVMVHVNSCGRGTKDSGKILGNGSEVINTKLSPGCFTIWVQKNAAILKSFPRDIGLSTDSPEKISIELRSH